MASLLGYPVLVSGSPSEIPIIKFLFFFFGKINKVIIQSFVEYHVGTQNRGLNKSFVTRDYEGIQITSPMETGH